ncbi:MAG: cytochrome c biogenesis protein CcsA [Hydrogenobaculum sp.]
MILYILNIIFYLMAFVSFLLYTLKAKNTIKYSLVFIMLGNLSYLVKLVINVKTGVAFSNIDAIVAFSGNVIMLFYGILLTRFRNLENIGFIISFIGALFSMANLRNVFLHQQPSLLNPIFLIHIISAGLSYSFIMLGGIFSLLKLISEKQIKQKKFSKTYVPIYTLIFIEKLSINMSFIFLTITILFGVMWSFYYDKSLYVDPKIIVISFLWFYYAILVHTYIFKSSKPTTISVLSALGSTITVISVIFIKHSIITG